MNVIYAAYDAEGIYVYQAFRPKIVAWAVDHQYFGKGFGLERMSWIKPSLGWILRRSKYATKNRMTAIAQVKISHQAWLHLLEQSIPTHFSVADFAEEHLWKQSLDRSDVIHQWDPERALNGKRLDRQAIQVGLRGEALRYYAQDAILEIKDVTALALEIGQVVKKRGNQFPEVLEEQEYNISVELKKRLGYGV